MLIIIPINGLLNRLRAINSACILSKQLHTKCYVFWIEEPNVCNCTYEDIFTKSNSQFEEIKHLPKNMNPMLPMFLVCGENITTLRGHHHGEQRYIKSLITNGSSINVIRSGGNFYDSETYNRKEFLNEKSLVYQRMEFAMDNILMKTKINCDLITNQMETSIGVHLRFSDLQKFDIKTLKSIYENIVHIFIKHTITDIYIIGDNENYKQTLYKMLTNNNCSCSVHTIKTNNYNRDNSEAIKEALHEWCILSKCKYIIFNNRSSFSTEACVPFLNSVSYHDYSGNMILRDF